MSEATAAKRILVIDDEQDVIEIVRALLSTKGHEVITAAGGEEGLALAESERPDLIITDLMMPRVSGLEVIKQLKKNARLRTTPIVVISALGDEKRPPDFWVKSLGVEDYVPKPFDPLDFIGRIEYLFRRNSYVSSQVSDFDSARRRPATPASDLETQIPFDAADASPSMVVRTFVESWNKQDFPAEYHCLGEEMLGQLSMREYVSRRRTAFVNDKGFARRHEMLSVDEEKISLNIAKVGITRRDTTNNQSKERKEVYSLKKTNRGWKIVSYRAVKEPTS
ncbi:response regulator [Candidatus Sumerlaeota bacterium]|nr:response regulator [Candidatus Sumerlaeota bacterium]